jgi:hypothetical protein
MRICNNAKVRLPTVNVCTKNGVLPNIWPTDPSSANLTSDGYIIDKSPYLLVFIVDSTVGYFSSFSATFTAPSGYDPNKVFIPCNIITNPQGSGLDNYLIYYVLNAVLANGQTQRETFNYKVAVTPYLADGSASPTPQVMNTGSIQNDPNS